MRPRRLALLLAPLAVVAALPASAAAHGGLVGRQDLPVPGWLFGWGAALVLLVTVVGLGALWGSPRLARDRWRALPDRLGRTITSRAVEVACGLTGVVLLGVVVWSGFLGRQDASENLAPTFVYVVFWVGLVPASVLFGDVFRAFNPWRALGHASAWLAGRSLRFEPGPLHAYPERLGRWPAAAGLVLFTWLELIAPTGSEPQSIALATLLYTALTLWAMILYGVEPWIERGEAFSVYFNLFSRMGVFERRDRRIGVRPPLSALMHLQAMPGTAAVLAVMIGSVSFDGAGEGAFQALVPSLRTFFVDLGLPPTFAGQLTFGVGYAVAILLVYALFRVGIAAARWTLLPPLPDEKAREERPTARRLTAAFASSLVPIAFAYVAAHYVSLLVFRSQALPALVVDPLGRGSASATAAIDYGVLGASTFWYVQVGLVIAGHAAGLTVAHDRALSIFGRAREAVRSQYPLLAVMIGFTTLALWLLNQQNEG